MWFFRLDFALYFIRGHFARFREISRDFARFQIWRTIVVIFQRTKSRSSFAKSGILTRYFRDLSKGLVCHSEAITTVYNPTLRASPQDRGPSAKKRALRQVLPARFLHLRGRCGRRVTVCRPIGHALQLAGAGTDDGAIGRCWWQLLGPCGSRPAALAR